MALLGKKDRWAEGAIVYQVYPRSFYDSNADGIGDIPGVTAKLDYLKSFGVNAVWLSPFFTSPMADFGYDVADYTDVDPIFGRLSDVDELLKQAHKRGIKIMVDLVPNHSSDQHEWFRQSRQSREGKYADWYIWRDPKGFDKNKKPKVPNNWLDIFTGETAWEWVQSRGQFYLHSFDIHQPDLNWVNPEVREAIKNVMRFWLDRGVDGFRVDAVRFMGKDPTLADNPRNPHWKPGHNKYGKLNHVNSQGWPQLYTYLNEMAGVLKEPKYSRSPRFMVTESYPEEPIGEYMAHYQLVDSQVAAPFIFEGFNLPWHPKAWADFLTAFHSTINDFSPNGIPSYAFGNHDQHRLASRVGERRARSMAVMLLTLPGMSFIYNGEEIGMKNGHIPAHLVQDPGAADGGGRDPERTPLQWTAGRNAGFTEAATPWLPVADDYPTRNIQSQSRDPHSFLSLYRSLGKLRNGSQALRKGDIEVVPVESEKVLIFIRKFKSKQHVVVVNFEDEPVTINIPKGLKLGKLQVSSTPDSRLGDKRSGKLHLHAHEAAVFGI